MSDPTEHALKIRTILMNFGVKGPVSIQFDDSIDNFKRDLLETLKLKGVDINRINITYYPINGYNPLNQDIWSRNEHLIKASGLLTAALLTTPVVPPTVSECDIFLRSSDQQIKQLQVDIEISSGEIKLNKWGISELEKKLVSARNDLSKNIFKKQQYENELSRIAQKQDECLMIVTDRRHDSDALKGGARKKSKSKRNSKKRSKKSK